MEKLQKYLLRKKIFELPDLPTIPANVLTVLGLLRESEIKMNKLLGAINKDQVLVAEILKLINSGFYGLRKEVTTINHAVNLLGVNKLKELLYSITVMSSLSGKGELLWLHSYSSFCLMEDVLRQYPELNVSPNLPLTMLMHDIGQVVLDKLNPTSHKVACQDCFERKLPLADAERQLMGVDHAEAGGWLMESWRMDEDTIVPIAYHHSDEIPPTHQREAAVVQIVDYIDSFARDIPTKYPSPQLLEAAGIVEFNREFWVSRQERMIASLDKANPAHALALRKKP